MATLAVISLGALERELVDAAAAGARNVFALGPGSVRSLAAPSYALHPGRKQHHAAAIVRKLAAGQRAGPHALVLGVGDLELFDPDGPAEVGEGDRDLHAAVLGVRRLRHADATRTLRRVRLAGIWAVGRALGLADCDSARCPMAPPDPVEALDQRDELLCAACQQLLVRSGRAAPDPDEEA